MTYNHENAVDAFMREAEANDPERFRSVCAKNPVKTRRQIEYIRTKEKSFGLLTLGDTEGLD